MSDMLVHQDEMAAVTGSTRRIAPRPPGMPPLPPANQSQRQILIVEKDKDCARVLEFVLNLQGYHVTKAHDFASAAGLIRSERFGQILMDVTLPDGSAVELLGLIRREMKLTTPVTIVSGHRQQRVVDDCMSAGADDFVSKPFSPSELVMRLGRWTRS